MHHTVTAFLAELEQHGWTVPAVSPWDDSRPNPSPRGDQVYVVSEEGASALLEIGDHPTVTTRGANANHADATTSTNDPAGAAKRWAHGPGARVVERYRIAEAKRAAEVADDARLWARVARLVECGKRYGLQVQPTPAHMRGNAPQSRDDVRVSWEHRPPAGYSYGTVVVYGQESCGVHVQLDTYDPAFLRAVADMLTDYAAS